MNLPEQIRDFYDRLQFPGHYTIDDLNYHWPEIQNFYLQIISTHVEGNSVLDVGCGTGLVTNIIARYHPDKKFTGIDFAQGAIFAENFAKTNDINNASFKLINLFDLDTTKQFDTVVCQGVLHHIPDQERAVQHLKDLILPGGILILGVYHPWGKLLKRIMNLSYSGESILQKDQESNPFELSYTKKQITQMFSDLELITWYPKLLSLSALARSYSGGLSIYVWRKHV